MSEQNDRQKLTLVSLNDFELTLLDGQCSAKVQEQVEWAKERIKAASTLSALPTRLAQFVADVISLAKKKGEITYCHESITHCALCGRDDGYFPVARATKYKRKGQPDYDKPKVFGGIDLNRGMVVMKHHVSLGGCEACVEQAKPYILDALKDAKVQLPKSLTGEWPRYVKSQHYGCSKCGWKGVEIAMGRLRTLMGDGYYHGECPSCKTQNRPLGSNPVKRLDTWELVEVKWWKNDGHGRPYPLPITDHA